MKKSSPTREHFLSTDTTYTISEEDELENQQDYHEKEENRYKNCDEKLEKNWYQHGEEDQYHGDENLYHDNEDQYHGGKVKDQSHYGNESPEEVEHHRHHVRYKDEDFRMEDYTESFSDLDPHESAQGTVSTNIYILYSAKYSASPNRHAPLNFWITYLKSVAQRST